MKQLSGAIALVTAMVGSAHAVDRLVPSQYPTIQAAINAANQGDSVVISPGTYPESINFNGKAITVRGTAGGDAIRIEPPTGPGVRFTSGEGPGSVLESLSIQFADSPLGGGVIVGAGTSPTLNIVRISSNDAVFGGGAVINAGASPTFTFCRFTSNNATSDGGGVACLPGSSPTFDQCTFIGNDAGGSGGAIHAEDADVTIMRCTFESFNRAGYGGALAIEGGTLDYTGPGAAIPEIRNNQAVMDGGGIYLTDAADATFRVPRINLNTAGANGGGIAITGGASATITLGDFDANGAVNGGGIAVLEGHASISETEFYNNHATSIGGGLFVISDGAPSSAHVSRSWFHSNRADHGAAISARSVFLLGAVPSTILTLYNSVVESNTATDAAGSAGVEGADAGSAGVQTTIDIRSCTIADNTGGAVNGVVGVAMPSQPQITLYNSIVRGNAGADFSNAAARTTTGYSIFPEFASYPGAGNFDADPMFSDEPFMVYELARGSPARDAGSNLLVNPDTNDADGDGDTTEPFPYDFGFSSPGYTTRFFNDTGMPNVGVGPGDIIDIGATEAENSTSCALADYVGLGMLDFDDVLAFLTLFSDMNPAADLAPPFGVWDFSDVFIFLTEFGMGCPG
ncbi:MAG: GC-type dockerin domain-anchored protein [Phycisphaerales bacterium]